MKATDVVQPAEQTVMQTLQFFSLTLLLTCAQYINISEKFYLQIWAVDWTYWNFMLSDKILQLIYIPSTKIFMSNGNFGVLFFNSKANLFHNRNQLSYWSSSVANNGDTM